MKNCRVVATYFGPRRHVGQAGDDAIDILQTTVDLEREQDNGAGECDLIIVNHDCGHVKGKEFLDSLDGQEVKNGVIKVLHRDWDKGRCESFGSFNYAFEKFENDYEYWFFSEDDYLLTQENYFGESIKQLDMDKSTAFICACQHEQNITNDDIILDTSNGYPPHAHGGCGLSHRKYLRECHDKYGSLPHPYMTMSDDIQNAIKENKLDAFESEEGKKWYRNNELNGEVRFTNVYTEMGYHLKTFKGERIVFDVRGQEMH